MSPRVFRRAHGPRRRTAIPRRALSVGAGGVLVAAMVLGAATSSAQGGQTPTPAEAETLPVAAAGIVTGDPVPLLGFAPPPKRVVETAALPQFRIAADLPTGPLGIPGIVLQAYKMAATRVDSEEPACKLPWFLLAGIGRIESNHAENGSVDQYGTTINPILGPVLDGTLPGNEVVSDGHGGHQRAIGPMQFMPGTWAVWGADGNGDGIADPNNIFDATYSAGRYLCAGFTDIMTAQNKVAAVLRYNHSMDYVANVLAWAAAYATGVMPTNPIPEPKHLPAASMSPSSKPKKPGQDSSDTSSPSTTTTTTTPAPTCLGAVCLPPNLVPPNILPPGLLPTPPATTPPAKTRPTTTSPLPGPKAKKKRTPGAGGPITPTVTPTVPADAG